MPGSTARPVRLLITVSAGGWISTPSSAASSPSRTGSTRALWNALVVFSRRTRISRDSNRAETASMSATGPLMTLWAPLSAAMLRPAPSQAALCAATASATASAGAKTAAMPPPAMPDSRSPRAAAKRIPSSRLNTPAACAAAISPTLCPTTTAGRTPTLAQSAVRAHSSA